MRFILSRELCTSIKQGEKKNIRFYVGCKTSGKGHGVPELTEKLMAALCVILFCWKIRKQKKFKSNSLK